MSRTTISIEDGAAVEIRVRPIRTGGDPLDGLEALVLHFEDGAALSVWSDGTVQYARGDDINARVEEYDLASLRDRLVSSSSKTCRV